MHKVTVSPDLLKRGRKSTGANSLGDMVSIRYGFHPDSLDHKSKMQLDEDRDKGNWVLRGSGGSQGTHVFSGGVAPASDLECVLVWDASSNSYVLHPLDATLRVSRDKAAGGSGARATRTASPESTDGLGISLPGAGKIVSEEELRQKREVEAREAKIAAAAKAQAAEEAAEAARLEAELMEADMGLEEEKEEKKPEEKKPVKAAAKKAPQKKKPAPKPAAKRPPTSTPTAAASSSESDVDDDFGDLANELEESLEQFSKDDDGDVMMIVDDSHEPKPRHSWNVPAGGGGPMSLRGYAGGRREEDELSSSEEE
ncbi:hypothetical protein CJU89_3776 [Yarrowia sp. B02]|nr:hypothetical protein CJU89_3776 [Yarrowia sp. B02]